MEKSIGYRDRVLQKVKTHYEIERSIAHGIAV